MTTNAEFIALDPLGYRLIAECEGGKAWYVPSVEQYLISVKEPVKSTAIVEDGGVVKVTEFWTNSLVDVVMRIGGHDASPGAHVGVIDERFEGQLELGLDLD